MKDKMIFSWKAFASLVKVKLRYTFFRSEEYYEDIDGNYYQGNDIIADISSMVGVVRRMLPVGINNISFFTTIRASPISG